MFNKETLKLWNISNRGNNEKQILKRNLYNLDWCFWAYYFDFNQNSLEASYQVNMKGENQLIANVFK